MADTIKTNLGPVTAYADAKAHGYTGTREQFGQLLANAGLNLKAAETAKEGAEAAKQAAKTAQQAAAENQKNAETQAANAKASADSAAKQANAAKESATGAANSASAAQESETNAGLSATAAANAEAAAKQAQNSAETAKTDAEAAKTAAGTSADASAASAADAKKTLESIPDDYSTLSGKVDENANGIRELKEDLGNITDCERINPSHENHYIATNGDVGSVVNIESPTVYNGFNCYVIPCIAGDKFTVNVTGGTTPRVYAWLNSEKEIIYAYGANETLKKNVLTAPANSGFLVVNDNSDGSVYKGVYVSEKIKEMKSANTNNIAWLKANIQNTIVGNLIDFTKSKRGYYLANDGITEVENESYSYTDFIELCGYTTIYRAPTRTSSDAIFLYDVDKNKIYRNGFGSETEYVIPEEYREKAVYFRMNYSTSAGDDKLVMLSYHSENISKYGYIEHGSYIQKNYILSNPNPMLNDTVNGGQCAIFRKMGFIGDSLSSGEVYKYDGTQYIKKDFYEHSWGQYLARACGSQGFNFSRGGLRVDTWLSEYYTGGVKASKFTANKCEMYTIALAVNDAMAIQQGQLTLGSPSDIDLSNMDNNANTYYGCYAKIIQYIKSLVPQAKIFVITNPNGGETLGLNGAIRYMAETFENVYLLDMYAYSEGLYTSSYLTSNNLSVQGHLTPSGYIRSAEHIGSYIDYIIRNNMAEFMDVCYILEE